MTTTTSLQWNALLLEQLDWHWQHQLRPRLDGLTDDEYFWEPVPGAWNVRRDGSIDWEYPQPVPAPVTTIAWRIAHLTVECLSIRTMNHFGGATTHWETWEYTDRADEALARLDAAYDSWSAGVAGLGEEGLTRPVGPAEGPWADSLYADLVLHINRELIHHGAEICLLRDLYLRRKELR